VEQPKLKRNNEDDHKFQHQSQKALLPAKIAMKPKYSRKQPA